VRRCSVAQSNRGRFGFVSFVGGGGGGAASSAGACITTGRSLALGPYTP
jgi:hypothetical protein